jgi:hypothetical protein
MQAGVRGPSFEAHRGAYHQVSVGATRCQRPGK